MLSADEVAGIVAQVSERVTARVEARALDPRVDPGEAARSLSEVIHETLWWEQDRLGRAEPDDDDALADRQFYAELRRRLAEADAREQTELLTQIIRRYADEIAGNFNPTVYKLAARVGPPVLSALLTGLSPRRLFARDTIPRLDQHLVIEGNSEVLAKLRERGTLVVTPTHSSNLDSLVLGFAIHALGLPPLTYGAGINLFRNPIVGRFMHNLGAYTVDRRKLDPLYKQTLKEYATTSLESRQDNLYFPAGSRSRSGAVERTLKKGLLGCSLAAYRNNLRQRREQPAIFVVPCTIAYPLVLEASTMIADWLAEAGKSRFIIVDDEFSRWERWLDFLRGLFALDLKITLRFGQPLDPFGNPVDEEGRSLDPRGRVIEPRGYLEVDGEIADDPVRDGEYTRSLERAIIGEFERETVVYPTHLLAFACFELLRRERPQLDLYRLLGDLRPDHELALPAVADELEALRDELEARFAAGELRAAAALAGADTRALLRSALSSFGTYHGKPVVERRGVRLHIGDARLLLYYRNRLDGYGLRGAPTLTTGAPRA